MTYQLLEQYSSAFVGPPMTPKGFAIHWWGDPAHRPTFQGILNVLLERGEQQSASVHFEAEAGLVACLVPVTNVAWGQGDGGAGWGNLNLVSIECNPRCTAGDRETVAELMADQHLQNGVPLVAYPHNKFTSTQCPGVWEQHIPWLVSRAKQIVAAKQGKTPDIAPQGTTTTTPKEDTLSAAEVKAIKDHATEQADRVIDYVGKVLVSGYSLGDQKFPGIAKVDINNQQTIRATLALVQQLAANPNMTAEQVTEAVGKALAEGSVEVDVTFNGKPEVV